MKEIKFFNKKRIIILSGIVLFVALLILATFFDLQISKSIADLTVGEYYSRNIFARIFETVGEMPIYVFVAFAFSTIFFYCDKMKDKTYRLLVKALCACIVVIMYFSLVKKFVGYIANHYAFEDKLGTPANMSFVLASLILTVLTIYVLSKQDKETIARLYVWAIIVICTAIISQIIAQTVKIFASRPRFRTMAILQESGDGGFDMFKRWYEFSGIKKVNSSWLELGIPSDGLKSFPSGHTAAATIVVTLLILPQLLPKLNNKKCNIAIWCVAVLYPIIVAFSRIVMGAHFLSDVLVGGGITVIAYWISLLIIKVKGKSFGIKEENKRVALCEELIDDEPQE